MHEVTLPSPTGRVELFLDKHNTHNGCAARLLCDSNGIALFLLPPYLTHLMQPINLQSFSTYQTPCHEGVRKVVHAQNAKNILHLVASCECSLTYSQALSPWNGQ